MLEKGLRRAREQTQYVLPWRSTLGAERTTKLKEAVRKV